MAAFCGLRLLARGETSDDDLLLVDGWVVRRSQVRGRRNRKLL